RRRTRHPDARGPRRAAYRGPAHASDGEPQHAVLRPRAARPGGRDVLARAPHGARRRTRRAGRCIRMRFWIPTIALIALSVLILLGMRRGWRGRSGRTAAVVGPLPEAPVSLGTARTAPFDATYVGSTTA